ncbi:MAG: hypothetical protein Q9209_007503 [Squamulea sp. 1 TL-2023]
MASPKISIRISLSPEAYHFSDSSPPELTITVTSSSDKPSTMFTHSTILDPRLALRRNRFIITDLTNGLKISQSNICIKRSPFKRIRGCSDEKYFITIQPGVPSVVTTTFGPDGRVRPQPRSEKDGDNAHGVDGLEPGHNYRLSVVMGRSRRFIDWWRWGTKDDILTDKSDAGGHRLSSIKSEKAKLNFAPIKPVVFSVEE